MSTKSSALKNPFRAKRITDARLSNFAEDVVSRLSNSGKSADYASFVNKLGPTSAAFKSDLVDVDASLSKRKSKKQERAAFVKQFKKQMREKKGAIAHRLGGFQSPGFIAFYPHGISEYATASMEQVPNLIGRVDNETKAYATSFDAELTTLLQNFKPDWDALADGVSSSAVSVGDKRNDRSAKRIPVEDILFDIVHEISGLIDAEQQASALFDFSLLYPKKRGKKTGSSQPVINNNPVVNTPPHNQPEEESGTHEADKSSPASEKK